MARMTDLPERTQAALAALDCPRFEKQPFIGGPPLSRRRVAVVSSAGLMARGDRPFAGGEAGYRAIPQATPGRDVLMSHVSVNYDRTGFQQDINVVLPLDRLSELAAEGVIGSVGEHYSFMGATDPTLMQPEARALAGRLKADGVDAVVLLPV